MLIKNIVTLAKLILRLKGIKNQAKTEKYASFSEAVETLAVEMM